VNDLPVTRHPVVVVLAVIVFAEAALLGIAAAVLIVELIVAEAQSVASAVGLIALALVAAVLLAVAALGLLRGRAWVRSAIVVWQVLQIAVAVGAFQGIFARPDVGWLLLIPAIAAIVLVLSRPVVAFASRRGDG
jgi:hypothetical protein